MPVERHLVGAGGLRDGIDADAAKAVFSEQVARRRDDAVPRLSRRVARSSHGWFSSQDFPRPEFFPQALDGMLPICNIETVLTGNTHLPDRQVSSWRGGVNSKANPVETQAFDHGIDALLRDPMTRAVLLADRLDPSAFRATLRAAAAKLAAQSRSPAGSAMAVHGEPPRPAPAIPAFAPPDGPPDSFPCHLAARGARQWPCEASPG